MAVSLERIDKLLEQYAGSREAIGSIPEEQIDAATAYLARQGIRVPPTQVRSRVLHWAGTASEQEDAGRAGLSDGLGGATENTAGAHVVVNSFLPAGSGGFSNFRFGGPEGLWSRGVSLEESSSPETKRRQCLRRLDAWANEGVNDPQRLFVPLGSHHVGTLNAKGIEVPYVEQGNLTVVVASSADARVVGDLLRAGDIGARPFLTPERLREAREYARKNPPRHADSEVHATLQQIDWLLHESSALGSPNDVYEGRDTYAMAVDLGFRAEATALLEGESPEATYYIVDTGHSIPVGALLAARGIATNVDMAASTLPGERLVGLKAQLASFSEELGSSKPGESGFATLIDCHRDTAVDGQDTYMASRLPTVVDLLARGITRVVSMQEASPLSASLSAEKSCLAAYYSRLQDAGIELVYRGIDPRER